MVSYQNGDAEGPVGMKQIYIWGPDQFPAKSLPCQYLACEQKLACLGGYVTCQLILVVGKIPIITFKIIGWQYVAKPQLWLAEIWKGKCWH